MTEREKNLKRRLECYQVPAPDKEKKERTKKKMLVLTKSYRMTDRQFILGQIRHIRPRIWIGQFLTLFLGCLGFWIYGREGYAYYQLFTVISTMTPLFLVFQIEELAKVSNRSMLEIEFSTRNSLKKLMLSRLCILGMVDFLILSIWITFLNYHLNEDLFKILLYSLVPFNITVIGLLYLLNHTKRNSYGYQAFAYTVVVCACFVVIPHHRPLVYSADYQNIWILLFWASIFILVKTIKETWQRMEYYEKMEEIA